MSIFPEHINRKDCTDLLRKNELALMTETAKAFTKEIDRAVKELDSEIRLEFPQKLPSEYRIILAKELLNRFGKFKVEDQNGTFTSSRLTDNPNDISKNIKAIFLEL